MFNPSPSASPTAARFKVRRIRLAARLLAIMRPDDASEATLDADGLQLTVSSQTIKIPFRDLETAMVTTGHFWSRIRFRHAIDEITISGLRPREARAFADSLEAGKLDWWRRELAPRIEIVRSIHDHLTSLDNPSEYLTKSNFQALERKVVEAVSQLGWNWPEALLREPEF